MHHNQRPGFQVQCLVSALMIAVASPMLFLESSSAAPALRPTFASWGDIFSFLGRRRRDQGGKGEGFCLLTPFFGTEESPANGLARTLTPIREPGTTVVWHDRPLFVWRGLNQTIGLREKGSQTIFWRQTTESGNSLKQIQYTGNALRPNTTYEVLFFSSADAPQPVRFYPFTVLPNPEQETIAADLKALTAQLQTRGANPTAIAQRQAQYFAQRHLEADVWQILYSTPNLSPQLQQDLANAAIAACKKPAEK